MARQIKQVVNLRMRTEKALSLFSTPIYGRSKKPHIWQKEC